MFILNLLLPVHYANRQDDGMTRDMIYTKENIRTGIDVNTENLFEFAPLALTITNRGCRRRWT